MFSIGTVERETGIGWETLRIWERRYGFPTPERNELMVAALLLAVLSLPLAHAAPPPKQGAKPVPVIVSQVRVERFVDRVEALSTLKANESVSVTANVTETVSAIHFDDGQRVEAGQVLVEMTSAEEHALLEEGSVRVAEADRQ